MDSADMEQICGTVMLHAGEYSKMQAEIERLRSARIADAARVVEWALAPDRRRATEAFAAGPERQAAYWIEWVEGRLGKCLNSKSPLESLRLSSSDFLE